MGAQVIGETLGRGFAGTYSRENAYKVITGIAGAALTVGQAVKYDSNGKIVPLGASSTAAQFLGVVVRNVKQATAIDQTVETYAANEVVPVITMGNVVVAVDGDTDSSRNGSAFIQITAGDVDTVGAFVAKADATPANTIELTNARFNGTRDADNLAELSILYPINA